MYGKPTLPESKMFYNADELGVIMDILELCKGKYASEIDSIVTDVEGNI